MEGLVSGKREERILGRTYFLIKWSHFVTSKGEIVIAINSCFFIRCHQLCLWGQKTNRSMLFKRSDWIVKCSKDRAWGNSFSCFFAVLHWISKRHTHTVHSLAIELESCGFKLNCISTWDLGAGLAFFSTYIFQQHSLLELLKQTKKRLHNN